mgnify:CR=1 FL=1
MPNYVLISLSFLQVTKKLKDNKTDQVHVVKDLTFSFITTTNFCGFSMLNLTVLQVQNKMKDTNNHSKFLNASNYTGQDESQN